MAYQTYIGQTTILGVPNIGTIQGIGMFEPTQNTVQDRFAIAEQIDRNGDVVRVTPYRQTQDCQVTFYPMGVIQLVDFPEPLSLVTIEPVADLPCPKVYLGNWAYVSGDIVATNSSLLVMRLQLRRWNPRYAGGPTYTPPTTP